MDNQPPDHPSTVGFSIPPAFVDHPLIKQRLFCTLPTKLLEIIERNAWVRQWVTADLLPMERSLAEVIEQHPHYFGFASGVPVQHFLFEIVTRKQEVARLFGFTKEDFEWLAEGQGNTEKPLTGFQMMSQIENLMPKLTNRNRGALGYMGWLISNPQYLKEQEQHHARFQEVISEGRMSPYSREETADGVAFGMRDIDDREKAFTQFFQRWRLTALDYPNFPTPVMKHDFMFENELSTNRLQTHSNRTLSPDIAPPEGSVAKGIVMPLSSTQHLATWMRVVDPRSSRRDQRIDRYARLFPLLHYWRVLHRRHPKIASVGLADRYALFAEHLNVSDSTIRDDMQAVTRNLRREGQTPVDVPLWDKD